MILTTKYDLGQTVFAVESTSSEDRHTCPACGGEGKIKALDLSVQSCATCYGRGHTVTRTSTFVPVALKIGEVRARMGYDEGVQYMCVETGIGTGRVWSEEKLHLTRVEAAIDAAQQLVAQEDQKRRRLEAEINEAEELVENLAEQREVEHDA